MTLTLYLLMYASAVVFVAACVARAVWYARAPIHLRWELYPVPHEEAERAAHGGSYFEEGDWWTKRPHFNLWGELKVMAPEILFLKGLWEFNRNLWYRSFPFHFGLYLLIASLGLLSLAAVLELPGLRVLYAAAGYAGAALVVFGAAALLARRLTDPELRVYTARGDLFNLVFFLATFALIAAGYFARPSAAPSMVEIARGLLTLDTSIRVPPLLGAGLALGSLLAAYIPLTHMSHFIAKYFTYHCVRWDDQPVARRREIGRTVAAYLAFKPTWSAPHLGADGRKTWADVAGSNPWEKK
jgi:nitrate reductase gamma subunit